VVAVKPLTERDIETLGELIAATDNHISVIPHRKGWATEEMTMPKPRPEAPVGYEIDPAKLAQQIKDDLNEHTDDYDDLPVTFFAGEGRLIIEALEALAEKRRADVLAAGASVRC